MYLGEVVYDASGNPVDATSNWDQTITAIATAYQMKLLADTNAERASQGLPPVDMSAIAPQVNVGIPPAQMQMLMLGVLGIIAAIYLSRKG